ncbi:hypothetical protein L6452_16546 [Arctium lappa]|uniref:Uncharacterized protein n=1 Tax=Arctium lappa TaxID=4217 RepID=A0ACB9C0T6_ARCLA|nr:hypothetical protein L6452_16546 [Arctium lappa]
MTMPGDYDKSQSHMASRRRETGACGILATMPGDIALGIVAWQCFGLEDSSFVKETQNGCNGSIGTMFLCLRFGHLVHHLARNRHRVTMISKVWTYTVGQRLMGSKVPVGVWFLQCFEELSIRLTRE